LLLNFATHLTLNTYRLIQESETLTTWKGKTKAPAL
jgi:hypothetical protein